MATFSSPFNVSHLHVIVWTRQEWLWPVSMIVHGSLVMIKIDNGSSKTEKHNFAGQNIQQAAMHKTI